jgi:exo-1,4-beta-D-glucosaminidase
MATPRMRVLVAATLCVAGTSLLATASASPGMAAATDNGPSVGATTLAAPTGRTGLTTLGLGGWRVQSSALATQTGSEISTPGFPTAGWLAVTPDDAGAPGTEMEAALQNGACPNVFYSSNMKKCFGFQNGPGPVVVPKFAVPWWYRTSTEPSWTTR